MRNALYILIACACSLSGCAYFPDFEHTPSARLPVSEVVNQIRCDMYEFLKDHAAGGGAFSLDPESYATVELALSTTAFGDVKFSKIDTVGLGAKNWLAVGSSVQPFPSLGLRTTSQVITKVQVNISQNPTDLREKCEHGYEYGYAELLSDKPEADRVLINQLRVSSWLKRTFESADHIVPSGPHCNARSSGKTPSASDTTCSVGLDTATLTTKFELIGDASGGILALGKLIPVVATPVLDLNVDYYHQIQIIFQGNNIVKAAKVAGIPKAVKGPAPPGARRMFDKDVCMAIKDELQRKRCLEALKAPPSSVPPQGSRPVDDQVARQLRSIRDALILNAPRP